MSLSTDLKSLYQIDDYQWLQETIQILKQERFQELDLENLIEELEDLGNERKNAVESLLEQVIRHLLLYQYWTVERENNSAHWQSEIYSFRTQLKRKLTTNLCNHLESELCEIYENALGYVQRKTAFSIDFPEECPYTLTQLFDLDWLP